MRVDHDTVRRMIADAAATEIVPRFQRLATGDVREKQAGDYVTVADEAAEAYLEPALTGLLPGSVCIGEEATARDRRILNKLRDPEPVWVIDPIDGTGNFARGRTPFAVMVALVEGGITLASWIHHPIEGWTAWAAHGEGAWLDGARLRVADPTADLLALRGTLHAGTFGSREMQRRIDHRRERLGTVRSLRCAGAEYVRLARGEQDYSLFTKLEPWDHAPGTLLFTEAGGVARLLDGRPYTPGSWRAGGVLLAANESTWDRVYETLFDQRVTFPDETGTD